MLPSSSDFAGTPQLDCVSPYRPHLRSLRADWSGDLGRANTLPFFPHFELLRRSPRGSSNRFPPCHPCQRTLFDVGFLPPEWHVPCPPPNPILGSPKRFPRPRQPKSPVAGFFFPPLCFLGYVPVSGDRRRICGLLLQFSFRVPARNLSTFLTSAFFRNPIGSPPCCLSSTIFR